MAVGDGEVMQFSLETKKVAVVCGEQPRVDSGVACIFVKPCTNCRSRSCAPRSDSETRIPGASAFLRIRARFRSDTASFWDRQKAALRVLRKPYRGPAPACPAASHKTALSNRRLARPHAIHPARAGHRLFQAVREFSSRRVPSTGFLRYLGLQLP